MVLDSMLWLASTQSVSNTVSVVINKILPVTSVWS